MGCINQTLGNYSYIESGVARTDYEVRKWDAQEHQF